MWRRFVDPARGLFPIELPPARGGGKSLASSNLTFIPGTPTSSAPTILVGPTVLGSFTYDARK